MNNTLKKTLAVVGAILAYICFYVATWESLEEIEAKITERYLKGRQVYKF